MERLLNIWQERSLYRADFIQQLKLAIEDSDSPKQKPAGLRNTCILCERLKTSQDAPDEVGRCMSRLIRAI